MHSDSQREEGRICAQALSKKALRGLHRGEKDLNKGLVYMFMTLVQIISQNQCCRNSDVKILPTLVAFSRSILFSETQHERNIPALIGSQVLLSTSKFAKRRKHVLKEKFICPLLTLPYLPSRLSLK